MTSDDGHGVPRSFGGTSERFYGPVAPCIRAIGFRCPSGGGAEPHLRRSARGDDRGVKSERMREALIMTDDTRDHDDFWYRGKTTRRRVLGYGASAGALGAAM